MLSRLVARRGRIAATALAGGGGVAVYCSASPDNTKHWLPALEATGRAIRLVHTAVCMTIDYRDWQCTTLPCTLLEQRRRDESSQELDYWEAQIQQKDWDNANATLKKLSSGQWPQRFNMHILA